ncbi:RecX family transcriptional regulator [Paenibacillus thermoaerophilus]|uniref:Regulatory protein RecX n=1 Tax=Paenibacillus thermoaerophilus TaxID=1215385 RepID=A0ABW2V0Z0_9BACL|nr:RecX family transcriptional regulator [Paenibacillus thermoaerophilus]TMV13866.1 recombinase RecX [Paenibacillus thermoaerophilus]
MSRTITSIEVQKRAKRRYNIYLDGEFAFSVHEDVLVSHRLSKGDRITDDRLEALLEAEERQLAWNSALSWLGRRIRSRKEMRDYLTRKGYAAGLIEETIERLGEHGYLDDAAFAGQWARNRLEFQGRGSRWIREELRQKGIEPELVSASLDQLEDGSEADSAYRLAVKKWRMLRNEEERVRRHKLKSYLLRRGYPGRIVQEAVAKVAGRAPADEEVWFEDDA